MIPRARLGAATCLAGNSVARPHEGRILQPSDEIPDLAHRKLVERLLERALHANLLGEERLILGHHDETVASFDAAVEHANHGHHTAIRVEVRVEDKRLEWRRSIAFGRRNEVANTLEKVVDTLARLAAHAHGVVGGNGKHLLDLLAHALRLGRGKVDLVNGRHDFEVGVHGQKRIGNGLRLHALRGIHDEHGPLAGSERARNLVGEVHMARRVDEVKLVGFAVVGVVHHANGIGLNGNPALLLYVHGVKHLLVQIALLHGMRELENAVGYGGLPVVDVSHDGEVPYE